MSDEIRRPTAEADTSTGDNVPKYAGMIVIGAIVGLVALGFFFRGYNAA